MTNIVAQRMVADVWGIRWIKTIFSEPSNLNALPLKCRCDNWVDSLIYRLKKNEIAAVLTAVNNIAAGMFYGESITGGIVLVHQFVMPKFRGWNSFKMAKISSDEGFKVYPDSTHQIGIISEDNKPSIAVALRIGFKKTGYIPRYHDGKDALILIREK